MCSDSKCKVWLSIIFAQLWLSVKSNLSSQLTKLNLWLPISTKMLPRHVHISGWPCTRLTPKTISNHHLLLGAQFSRNCCRTFFQTGTRGGAQFISLARKQNPGQSTLSSVKKKKRRTRLSGEGSSQATSMGDLSCKHLPSHNLLSKTEEEEKDDGQWWSTSPTD